MVSADQIANPLGAVVIRDGEVPRTFTAKAREVISGGTLVHVSGATGDVGSDAASYSTSDITVVGTQNSKLYNGVALNTVASGATVTIATKGAYLMNAGGIVSGGAFVTHNASGAVTNWVGNVSGTALINDTIIGRAQSTSASGTNNYVMVDLL